jgi:hypothetical protein
MVRRALCTILTVVLSVIVVAGVAWGARAVVRRTEFARACRNNVRGDWFHQSAFGRTGSALIERASRRDLARSLDRPLGGVACAEQLPPLDYDSSVTVQNVRNFKYRSESDYDRRWETRTYNLDRIRGVDLFLSFWGPTQIAHTIVSWDFEDGQHLAISIETRRDEGESYSAVRAFFRQYELYYVVADERDLVGLRTNYRGEQVYLYQIKASAS